jgi:predicted RNA-binding Zn-ribbon protein involved in translation (DUF1610 family)
MMEVKKTKKDTENVKELCDSCGLPLESEDAIHHSEKIYCPKCIVKHVGDEHISRKRKVRMPKRKALDLDYSSSRGTTAEDRRAWTYKDK